MAVKAAVAVFVAVVIAAAVAAHVLHALRCSPSHRCLRFKGNRANLPSCSPRLRNAIDGYSLLHNHQLGASATKLPTSFHLLLTEIFKQQSIDCLCCFAIGFLLLFVVGCCLNISINRRRRCLTITTTPPPPTTTTPNSWCCCHRHELGFVARTVPFKGFNTTGKPH